MKNPVAVLALLVCVGGVCQHLPAMGVTDVIGIYFDLEARNQCIELPTGTHHAYLIATSLSAETGMSGWECQILNDGPSTVMEWDLQWQAINVYPPPGFGVGFTTPMPRADSMVLLDISFFLFDVQPAHFYIQPWYLPSIEGVPVYAAGGDPGDLRPLYQSTGGPDNPVAVINGDCPVDDKAQTWGGLKALYR